MRPSSLFPSDAGISENKGFPREASSVTEPGAQLLYCLPTSGLASTKPGAQRLYCLPTWLELGKSFGVKRDQCNHVGS